MSETDVGDSPRHIGEMTAKQRAKRVAVGAKAPFVRARLDEMEEAIRDAEARSYQKGRRDMVSAVLRILNAR